MFEYVILTMLNKKAEKSNPDLIVKTIGNLEGLTIGDLGSGGGFFTFKFAEAVGSKGKVYALDNNLKNLQFIKKLAVQKGYKNINYVYCEKNTIPIKNNDIDILFSRNLYHHITDNESYFKKIKQLLKTNGKVIIIDHCKSSKKNFIQFFRHYTNENNIIQSMLKAGYKHVVSYKILKNQSFNIFECQ